MSLVQQSSEWIKRLSRARDCDPSDTLVRLDKQMLGRLIIFLQKVNVNELDKMEEERAELERVGVRA